MTLLPMYSDTCTEQQPADSITDEMEARGLVLPFEVRNYIRASLSENSRRAYRSDLNQFLAWGGTIPARPEMVARYLAAHAEQSAIATLSRRLVSIGKAHTAQGQPSPSPPNWCGRLCAVLDVSTDRPSERLPPPKKRMCCRWWQTLSG